MENTKKEDLLNQQAERGIQILEGAMDTLQGEAISATLDFLSKELVRKNERERLQGVAVDAQKERTVREAEEGGRRQAEENLRAREDMMLRQVTRVHQGTAESYTQELLSEQVDSAAHSQAVAEIAGNAAAVAPVPGGGGEEDETIRDLVASFLLPEVERHRVRQQSELVACWSDGRRQRRRRRRTILQTNQNPTVTKQHTRTPAKTKAAVAARSLPPFCHVARSFCFDCRRACVLLLRAVQEEEKRFVDAAHASISQIIQDLDSKANE